MMSSRPEDIVIVDAVRTPIGRAKRGAFKDTTPDILLSCVLKSLLERTGVPAVELGEICVGNVLQHGAGATCSRMAQFLAGIPFTVPLSTVNRQCSSGLQAVADVAAGIRNGYYDIGIAAGVESMSMFSMEDSKPLVDWDAIHACSDANDCALPMGVTSENIATNFSISRESQDAFALSSHAKAHVAQLEGRFLSELVPVATTIKNADGGSTNVMVTADEGIRPSTTMIGLGNLKAIFAKNGTTTAGNSSQVSDGAAAVLLASREKAQQLGLSILGIFCSYSVVGVPPALMGIGPAYAIPAVISKANLATKDIDVFEINEAFASQAVYCVQTLGLDSKKVNPNGGAIALGHPLGCTGARQVATLLYELRRSGGTYGIISMCVGTGMGAAALFKSEGANNRMSKF